MEDGIDLAGYGHCERVSALNVHVCVLVCLQKQLGRLMLGE